MPRGALRPLLLKKYEATADVRISELAEARGDRLVLKESVSDVIDLVTD
jgi:hypothetical protein